MAKRLYVVLLIPVLVALSLGAFRGKRSIDTLQDAEDAVRVAQLVQTANKYASDVINERDVSVVPLLKGKRSDSAITKARAITDQDRKDFDRAVANMPRSTRLLKRVAAVRTGEKALTELREDAFTAKLPGVQTEEKYHLIQHPLMELSNELGFGSSNQASFGRTLYALSLTQAAESLTRAIGQRVLVQDRDDLADGELDVQLATFRSYAYLQQVALQEFAGAGTSEDMDRLDQAMAAARKKGESLAAEAAQKAEDAGKPFVAPPPLEEMIQRISSGATAEKLAAEGITPESFFTASTLAFDAYRRVEVQLSDTALAKAEEISDDARRDALVNSVVVVAAVVLAFLLAMWVARSMTGSMRRLRGAALDIAQTQLPALVEKLSQPRPHPVNTRVAPIPIDTRDEIGEVARAFDQVHREAVQLAAEQALLRGNVSAIFTSLSRRSEALVEGQLHLLTDLEKNEADPDQLENLFRLDHLATRMRRNGENLLVLAGEEPRHRWDQPMPLIDTVRAAASEVEQYERVQISGIPETLVHGRAATDLVHLLAELLENATTFSSPRSPVRVTAAQLPDGRAMVEIHDEGVGLTSQDFAELNRKLADPPTVDAAISRRMGLFVVGRLAERHGIRVQLRPARAEYGAIALVMLPYTTLADEGAPAAYSNL
ncbi:sensor histidine kinase [Streptomyces justiciae]|uniref:sensor histidine kinase n=1 Tax=Streptomyces justiciae TaxID=2780140 RepID=UPI001882F007|nr:nitrate- and nitrite sensing domain-containing protein [Streptomyces justiciae]MBE8470695.1 nitrate- and nitrite sensing domain-containing protein [Streptomyces justiciae]